MAIVRANVTASVVKWARQYCHYSLEEAAAKIGRPREEISRWESGTLKPSIPQLRKASRVYRIPLATFYLPHPPKGFSPLRDYRRLPSDVPREYSPNLVFMVRQTWERQQWVKQYLQDQGYPRVQLPGSGPPRQDTAKLAQGIRTSLQMDWSKLGKCAKRGDALRLWVESVENLGVFVFRSGNAQHEKIDVEEARGFVLTDDYAPFIFLNAQDAKVAQVFTLAHELAHLCIGEPGVSNLATRGSVPPGAAKIEVFCNAVASEVVLPQEDFRSFWNAVDASEPLKERIERASREFKVSKEVVARRLLDLTYLSQAQYVDLVDLFRAEWKQYQAKERQRLREDEQTPSPYRMRLVANGMQFSRLVLEAYQSGRVSGRDVSSLLGIRLDEIGRYASYARMQVFGGRDSI